MPVTEQNTSNSYTGNGVTTVFAYSFLLLDQDDLKITIDGVVKTITTHYTVSGVGVPGGGNVTFTSAPASAAAIVILRNMPYVRETDYQENGDLLAAVLDEDNDRQTMLIQQVRDIAKRAIKLPAGVTVDQILPTGSTAAERADRVIGFDSAGNPTLHAPVDNTLLAVDLASTANGKGAALVGVQDVAGFYPAEVTQAEQALAMLGASHVISAKEPRFGVVADGITDDTVALQAFLTAAAGKIGCIPEGTYIASALTLPTNTAIIGAGAGRTTIKRKAATVGNANLLSLSSGTNATIRGITFDGNKAAQTDAANSLGIGGSDNVVIEHCEFINAKAVAGGYGSGLVITGGTGQTNKRKIWVLDNRFTSNDGVDLYINTTWYVEVAGNYMKGSGGGISVLNYVFPVVQDVHDFLSIHDNTIRDQTGSGISVSGFRTGGTSAADIIFGPTSPECRHVLISNNLVSNCSVYGIVYQGANGTVHGNTVLLCGGASGGGGALFNGYASVFSGNTLRDNRHYGVDAGGCQACSVVNNNVFWTAVTANESATDINCGGSSRMLVSGNVIEQAGTHAVSAIVALGFEGDGAAPFTITGSTVSGLIISNNLIQLNSNANGLGIWAYDGQERITVTGNHVRGAQSINHAYRLEVTGLVSRNNVDERSYVNGTPVVAVASATTLVVPDCGELFFVTGTTGITKIMTYSANVFDGKVRTCYATSHGSGYSRATPPTVTFAGGGGAGLAVTANVSYDGQVVNWTVTNPGSGYTSAPTPTITHNGGTGATCNPQVGCNNFEGREITLVFQGSLTVTDGSNLNLGGNLVASNNTTLRLFGAYGGWLELSRSVN